MATFYSDEFQSAYIDEPKSQLNPDKYNGRLRRIYASITLGAEITTADVVKFCKLPSNAVIKSAKIAAPGGSAGTLALGWAAGSEGLEAADADGLFAGLSGAAAISSTMDFGSQNAASFNKRFAEEVDIELSASVNTVGFSGDLVEIELEYVID